MLQKLLLDRKVQME